MAMIDDTCESILESNREVSYTVETIAKVIGNNDFQTEVQIQFNILNSTLTVLLSKFDYGILEK